MELTPEQIERISIPSLEKKWTPAEVSQILFRRHGNINEAIRDLVEEDPAKVFKFSQLKNEDMDVEEKEEEKTTPLPIAENILVRPLSEKVVEERQSTDLVELILKDMNAAPSSEGAEKKKIDESVNFYNFHFSKGENIENPSHKSIWQQQMEKNEDIKKDYEMMLNSSMFTNNDGFTAMNDTGLSTQGLMKHMGFAAANEDAETTLDDFFKEPEPI